MLASPGDVGEERAAAREIILDWNNINSPTRKIVLLPIGWEYNTSPTMGDRPQEIINKTILKNADVLVGIFWTRIGTPTGKSASGSVEEIEEHINSGKQAMLYFSNKPVNPSKLDNDQYEAVKKLKAEYQSKGLTENFDSLDDFKIKFQRHLSLKLNENYFEDYDDESVALSNLLNGNFKTASIQLSEEAKELLIEATKDHNGQIIRIGYSGGYDIQTNGKDFVKYNDPKSKALWSSALDELISNDLVKELSYEGEILEVTHQGYKTVEAFG